MYPAGAPPNAENWTLDTFLKAAEACHKAGFPFGIGLGATEDSVVAAGTIFQCFGATLVDANAKRLGEMRIERAQATSCTCSQRQVRGLISRPCWRDHSRHEVLDQRGPRVTPCPIGVPRNGGAPPTPPVSRCARRREVGRIANRESTAMA